MDVASLCPLPVGIVRWESPLPSVTVVIKATFALAADGEAELAPSQQPLTLDRPLPADPSELAAAGDFAPLKARADVLLFGGAYADSPAQSIAVSFRVNDLSRSFFALASAPSRRIPLAKAYLRAGPSPDRAIIEVGPRPPWSAPRQALASGQPLSPLGVPLGPLPRGFDFGFFNAAPPEQQLSALRANARIELHGLLPGVAARHAQLPLRRPLVFLVDGGSLDRSRSEIAVRCDTLTIDTDRAICTLTWRGLVDVVEGATHPRLLVAFPEAGEERSFKHFSSRFEQAIVTRAVEPDDLAAAPSAPSDISSSGRRDEKKSIAADTAAPTPQSDRIEAEELESTTDTLSPGERVQIGALPFAAPTDAAGEASRTQTRLDALPFIPASRPASPLSPPPPSPPIQADELPTPPKEPSHAEGAPLPIDVYAAIKAELWEEASPPDVVLARHGLDEVQWRVHERLHLEALASEARAGRSARALALMAALSAAQRGRKKAALSEQLPQAPST